MKNSTKIKKNKLANARLIAIPGIATDLATVQKVMTALRHQHEQHAITSANPTVETRQVEVVPPTISKGLVAIANTYFRAKKKMLDPTTGEPHESMARVYKDIDRIGRQLMEMGFQIKDHTGDAYDDGQPMKVITSNPRPEATRKYVLETLTPTIYWNDRIIQHAEIEIVTPIAKND